MKIRRQSRAGIGFCVPLAVESWVAATEAPAELQHPRSSGTAVVTATIEPLFGTPVMLVKS